MTSQQSFKGIVLKRWPYREQDLLVKLLTTTQGKKTFWLRGARKVNFKLARAILPFTEGEYLGQLHAEGLSFLNGYRQLTLHENLLTNFERNAYANYMVDLLDRVFDDQIAIPQWYDVLHSLLKQLDQGLDPEVLARILEIQLLNDLGVAPHLQNCVLCQDVSGPFDFSEKYGGIICYRHFETDRYRLHLDQKVIFYFRRFSVINLQHIQSIQLSATTKAGLNYALDTIYQNEVGLHLKSRQFLDQLPKILPKDGVDNDKIDD